MAAVVIDAGLAVGVALGASLFIRSIGLFLEEVAICALGTAYLVLALVAVLVASFTFRIFWIPLIWEVK